MKVLYEFQTTDDDTDAPPEVHYKWIARDVVPTQQEQPYELDEEPAETDRSQGNFVRFYVD